MLTLLAGLLSAVFALLALAAHFYERLQNSEAINSNQGVKDQLNTLDAKILGNQALIDAEKQALAEKEKNVTNQNIIDDLNSRK